MPMPQSEHVPAISIIGLGPTGRAIGSALRGLERGLQVHGHDRERANVQAAMEAGAVEKTGWNLVAVAEAADIVFLTEPLEETLETLAQILPHVRQNALVTDTVSLKQPIMQLAKTVTRPDVSFIGGHPVLSADGSLAGATWCLMPLASTGDEAIRALCFLIGAMGAQPFFIDAAEHDALAAGADQLPALLELTLVDLLNASPSARDLRRLASPHLQAATHASDANMQRAALLGNSSALATWLDQLLPRLQALRASLATADAAALDAWLAGALDAQSNWARAAGVPTPALEDPALAKAFDAVEEQGGPFGFLLGRLGRKGPRGSGD